MSIWNDGTDVLDGDVLRKKAIEMLDQANVINGGGNVEVSNHHAGVDSCVGTSCPHYFDVLAQDGAEGILERFLYAVGVRLYLPSMIGCTVV